ncbi:MAG: hypothetical protein KGY65_07610 [Candidatus Thermoplasmatota archaeon]|nr:hypothetical protein [Candidatus Thermoplasmatota archaeon]MBS3802599.1 hypothetical protein [Candidatus Thermoplasmatota archaeon]
MFVEQKRKKEIRCPECNCPMYTLEGAVNPIYVCSSCGTSVDAETIEQNRQKSMDIENQEKSMLLNNLFSNQFMKKYTEFESFSAFIKQCSFLKESTDRISEENIIDVPERKINLYVQKHTCFTTWDQMFEKALTWYLRM